MKHLDCYRLESSIKLYVEEKLSYSYLQKYIDSPQIDEDRISFLVHPFLENGQGMDEKDLISLISTVMLIQIALDTHQKVTNSSKDSLKERQLTVLAGVYFSGQYYKILSELENVNLINLLAQSIKIVNENKISLYKQEFVNIEEIMESVKIIESALVSNFLSHYGSGRMVEVAEEALFLRRILGEKDSLVKENSAPLVPVLKAAIFSTQDESQNLSQEQKEVISRVYDRYITDSRDRLSKMINDVSSAGWTIEKRLISLLEQTKPYMKIFAEEG